MCTHHVHDLDERESEVDDDVAGGVVDGTHRVVVGAEELHEQPLLVGYDPRPTCKRRNRKLEYGGRSIHREESQGLRVLDSLLDRHDPSPTCTTHGTVLWGGSMGRDQEPGCH